MAKPANLSEHIYAATGGAAARQIIPFMGSLDPISGGSLIQGRLYSLWSGTMPRFPGLASAPAASMVNPTKSTLGALPLTDATGGRALYLATFEYGGRGTGKAYLLDRLMQFGGFSGNSASTQTVNGTITRNTGGEGNRIFLEIISQIGVTARTVTAIYTNSSGTGSRTTQAVPIGNTGDREAGRWIELPWQAGDVGVQSLQSFILSAGTGSAGSITAVIANPIASAGFGGQGAMSYRECALTATGYCEIEAGSCLQLAMMPATASSHEMHGLVGIVEY